MIHCLILPARQLGPICPNPASDPAAAAMGREADNVSAACSGFPDDAMLSVLLEVAPRVVIEPDRAWLDVRGMPATSLHERLRARLGPRAGELRSGVATRPIVAWVAALRSVAGGLEQVEAGAERIYLQDVALTDLGLEDPLLGWLADVGIERCGELASIAREALEVRFGSEAVQWWRWSRGDDERRLFARVPPERPHGSVDFVDYVVTDPERLIFTANALLAGMCDRLLESGAHARRLRLRLPLANGGEWERTLRAARPTADRVAWLRLVRGVLERLSVPDAVAGVALEVVSTEAAASVQGDLFDTGFATSAAVEGAVARLLEDQGAVVREPSTNAHALAELRAEYRPLSLREATEPGYGKRENGSAPLANAGARERARPSGSAGLVSEIGVMHRPAEAARFAPPTTGAVMSPVPPDEPVGLTLQLLPEPRPVQVELAVRRDHDVPTRYRDSGWHALLHAAGPDRVSGGQWDATYAREYYRAVRADGTLVWLFRDACRDRWFLHGWWD